MSDIKLIIGNNRWGVRDGQDATIRAGKTCELNTGITHAEFYEPVSRSNCFFATSAPTGVAPGTSLSTTGAFTLHNPINSGKYLNLISASMSVVSGTLGAGSTYLTTHASAAVANPTGTNIDGYNCMFGTTARPTAFIFESSTVITQVPIRPLWMFGAIVATTAPTQPFILKEQFNGEIIVMPGFGVNLHSVAAAGSTPLVMLSMTWEEIPIS